jgi:moderate conductance mechanosensitive channel
MFRNSAYRRRFWVTMLTLFWISLLIAPIPVVQGAEADKDASPPPSAETLKPTSVEQVNQSVSRLTDKETRLILIHELEKAIPPAGVKESGWMEQLQNFSLFLRERVTDIGRHLPLFFTEIDQAIAKLTDRLSAGPLFLLLAFIIGLSLTAEWVWWRFSAGIRAHYDAAPVMQGLRRFIIGVLRSLPEFLGIVIFSLVGGLLFVFVLMPLSHPQGGRMLFVYLMLAIVLVRLLNLLSRLIWAPQIPHLRLVPVSDATALYLHRRLTQLISYAALTDIALLLIQNLGVSSDSQWLFLLALSIPLMVMLACLIWNHRVVVGQYLRQPRLNPSAEISWLRDHLASFWHVLALGYSALVWLLALGRWALFGPHQDQAFLISFMIVPLYLVLDQIGHWLVRKTLGTLRTTETDENTTYFKIALRLVRGIICVSLVLWLFAVWGVQLPFIEKTVNAAFNIMVTLVLAHTIWGLLNRYIQKKLDAVAPKNLEKDIEQIDEEFTSIQLDRSFTLLPMLRKFIGIVMVIMVAMIVLSSMGINIAPLLAGAGVVGLAISFGSRKLVEDILSGIFYITDDAFRIGEWIASGNVEGTVEGFNARNIRLRDSKGALQIIPFSKLGTITNYNRGGMIIKFNLELPYGTDIDMVRKTVKKVGESIQKNPEYANDIIRPIKYQGIKSISNSVMMFRVKFTARPGRQFLIQREAFRGIMEALAKKGIFFANRKVVVELPPGLEKEIGSSPSGTPAKPSAGPTVPSAADVLKAGAAAAAVQLMEEEEQQKTLAEKTKEDTRS